MSKKYCEICFKKCKGRTIKINENIFVHSSCFKCHECQIDLEITQFYYKLGRLYCVPHFKILYFPKCSACLKPIENETATVIGQQYHPECLFCSVCKKTAKVKDKLNYDGKNFICQLCLDKKILSDGYGSVPGSGSSFSSKLMNHSDNDHPGNRKSSDNDHDEHDTVDTTNDTYKRYTNQTARNVNNCHHGVEHRCSACSDCEWPGSKTNANVEKSPASNQRKIKTLKFATTATSSATTKIKSPPTTTTSSISKTSTTAHSLLLQSPPKKPTTTTTNLTPIKTSAMKSATTTTTMMTPNKTVATTTTKTLTPYSTTTSAPYKTLTTSTPNRIASTTTTSSATPKKAATSEPDKARHHSCLSEDDHESNTSYASCRLLSRGYSLKPGYGLKPVIYAFHSNPATPKPASVMSESLQADDLHRNMDNMSLGHHSFFSGEDNSDWDFYTGLKKPPNRLFVSMDTHLNRSMSLREVVEGRRSIDVKDFLRKINKDGGYSTYSYGKKDKSSKSNITYPLEDLKGMMKQKCKSFITCDNIENYLNEKDFEELFGMNRQMFNQLPLWKRNDLKKVHKLIE